MTLAETDAAKAARMSEVVSMAGVGLESIASVGELCESWLVVYGKRRSFYTRPRSKVVGYTS